MSQHYISTTQYEVLVGWDRPLKHFFGTVWNKARMDNENIVFATLSLPGGGTNAITELVKVLQPFAELLEPILKELIEDQELNRGNAVRHWTVDGA